MKTNLGDLPASESVLKLFDASLKITVLLAGLLLAVAVMRWLFNVSAARRASVLWLGVAAIPAIAIASFFGSGQRLALFKLPTPRLEASASTRVETAEAPPVTKPLIGRAIDMAATALNMPSAAPISPPPMVAEESVRPAGFGRWLVGIWLSGCFVVALRLGAGILTLNRRARSLRTESGQVFEVMAAISKELGLRRVPELRLAEAATTMPMTWGLRRHRIVLPAVASGWTRERLRLVLQHELSHVKRHDCVAAWSMRLLLAPAWFHPLAWLLARHATDLRERACDDAVAMMNADIDRYAHELVELSRGHRGIVCAVAMARPQRLKARIVALYCPRLGRGAATATFRSSAAILLALCALPLCLFSACQTTGVAPKSQPAEESKPANVADLPVKKTITPKPVFKKGEKKVVLQAIELTAEKKPNIHERFALKTVAEGEPNTIPAADLAKLENAKGADAMLMEPFPTGRTHKFKIAREFIYPLNPEADPAQHKMTSRDVGVMGDALVKPLPDGKLSVKLNFEAVEFAGFKADANGVERPEFIVRRINTLGPVTIENGGGISTFLIREVVQHSVDKVPILGDIPLVGRLFRSEAENRYSRLLMIRVDVSDP